MPVDQNVNLLARTHPKKRTVIELADYYTKIQMQIIDEVLLLTIELLLK